MPTRRAPAPDGAITRSEAAAILGVGVNRVSDLLTAGRLQRATGRKDGRCWRHEVEALARNRAASRDPGTPAIEVPGGEDATFEELMAAAEWTRDNPGTAFVDTEGAALLLGVSPQDIGRLAAEGRLAWLPTGRIGGGHPTRVYRRAQIQALGRAEDARRHGSTWAWGSPGRPTAGAGGS